MTEGWLTPDSDRWREAVRFKDWCFNVEYDSGAQRYSLVVRGGLRKCDDLSREKKAMEVTLASAPGGSEWLAFEYRCPPTQLRVPFSSESADPLENAAQSAAAFLTLRGWIPFGRESDSCC